MSTWQQNLLKALEQKEVVILHGNVRDRYINREKGLVYGNLTALLQDVARSLSQEFSKFVMYDPVGHERTVGMPATPALPAPSASGEHELPATAPSAPREQRATPATVLAKWARELSSSKASTFGVIFYLDKLVSYKQAYLPEEREILLHLEKLLENIAPANRLVMVALQDTMVPVELYTAAPKVTVLAVPIPDKEDRLAYLEHRLGNAHEHLELVADLSEGLFLTDLDNLSGELRNGQLSARQVRELVNRYRVGEQQDYWGSLSIEDLNKAVEWFIEKEGVKGQDEAVRKVVDAMTLARAGLSGVASGTPAKPKGVLFFAGPTGVGKTFLAKKLAKFLFNSEEAFIRFDMSEFKEEHTVSKLIGSPPGYVGYERGGMLTGMVRERPFSVVLFDEVEKAHPKIMDIFLQILDDGRLTDSRGQTVFFTETIIIFTSNIGTRTKDSQGHEIAERKELETILSNGKLTDEERRTLVHAHFTESARDFFMTEISRPELLNRIGDSIVPFNVIDDAEMQRQIVRSHLERIAKEFKERSRALGHRLAFSDETVTYLVDKHRDSISAFGGRAITNAIENEVMQPLAKALLRAEHRQQTQCTFEVAVHDGQLSVRVQSNVAT